MSNYSVIAAETHDTLTFQVSQMIADGWRPAGGATQYIRADGSYAFMQTVWRPEKLGSRSTYDPITDEK